MAGYFNDPGATADVIRDGWLHTGDLGYLSGGDLFVCGRRKDVIVANGRKYHPQDLEWSVQGLDGVPCGRTVAFGCPVPGAGDRVVFAIEGRLPDGPDGLAVSIRRRIADVFGLHVDEVVAVPSGTISRTTSGKVKRAAIRAWYQAQSLIPKT
jgi:fatty-acyl-CoA synthase